MVVRHEVNQCPKTLGRPTAFQRFSVSFKSQSLSGTGLEVKQLIGKSSDPYPDGASLAGNSL
jgi:hypothetical protein